jgi:Zn-dependent peptidase ImmA (M78 family)/transcriptional regulator with XRE-family HTH domain
MTFNPLMLTLAREAAGLTQGALAHAGRVSQAYVSKTEHGLEQPTPGVLEKFAEACSVPTEFFEQQDEILGDGLVDMFHKKRVTTPAKPLRQANALANIARQEALRLLRTVELDDVRPFPVFPIDEYDSPEEIASMTRATWRIPKGPLPDLIALVEAAAVPVYLLDLGHEKLRAISMPGLVGRHVIILNSQLPPSARRFALAHEIGHLVIHNGVGSPAMEIEADAFASALLMPAGDIRPRLRGVKFRDLGPLKALWRVSLAALIHRAHQLGEISDRHYRTLNIQLNKLPGGRRREPGEFEPERPRLLQHVLAHFQQELGYTGNDLTKLLVVREETLQERYFGQPQRALRVVSNDRPVHRVSMPQ